MKRTIHIEFVNKEVDYNLLIELLAKQFIEQKKSLAATSNSLKTTN